MVLTDETGGHIVLHGLGKRQFAQLYVYGMPIGIGKGQLIIMILRAQSLEQKTNAPLFRAYIENTFFQYIANEFESTFQCLLFLFGFKFIQSFPDHWKGIFYRFPEFRPFISWDATFEEIMVL